jgi:hypothetical protein
MSRRAGDEGDAQQEDGGQAGQVDGPDARAGGVAERVDPRLHVRGLPVRQQFAGRQKPQSPAADPGSPQAGIRIVGPGLGRQVVRSCGAPRRIRRTVGSRLTPVPVRERDQQSQAEDHDHDADHDEVGDRYLENGPVQIVARTVQVNHRAGVSERMSTHPALRELVPIQPTPQLRPSDFARAGPSATGARDFGPIPCRPLGRSGGRVFPMADSNSGNRCCRP